MTDCPVCGEQTYHHCPGPVPPEPPVGTWVRDRHGVVAVRTTYQALDGWAPSPHGFYPFGKWEAMWQAHGPLVECGPYLMFFCDDCAAERDWPKSMFKSEGRCEICGRGAVCNDVPSSRLPLPPRPPAEPTVTVPISLLERFVDDGPCWFDHHGHCQGHGYVLDPGEVCPNARLQAILKEATPDE